MRFRLALNSCLNVLVPGFRAPLTQPFCQLPANKALASHVVYTSPAGRPIFLGLGPTYPMLCVLELEILGFYPTLGRKLVPVRNLLLLLSWQLVFLPFFLLLLFLDFSQWMEVVSLSHHSINPVPGHGRFLCFLETAH